MAGITLAQAQAQLDAHIAALTALTTGGLQETEIVGRKVKLLDLGEIRESIKFWNSECERLEAKGTRTGRRARGGTIASQS